MKGGELRATVLSLHDLPTRDAPSYVSISACGPTVTSGAPTSRHKDRNAFKFTTTTTSDDGSSSELTLKAKQLSQLYSSQFTVEVVYENKPWLNMTATYNMNNLPITTTTTVGQQEQQQQPTWLSLTLEPSATSAASGNGNGSGKAVVTTSHDSSTHSSTMMEDDGPSTVRLKVQLRGPYRPEIQALLQLVQTWFAFMDHVEQHCLQVANSTSNMVPLQNSSHKKWLLIIPAVPMVTVSLVVAPIVAGLCVLFLPIFVPVLAAVLVVTAVAASTTLTLYASTSTGRKHVQQLLGEQLGLSDAVVTPLLTSSTGQALVYETGPRPTPVSVAKTILPSDMWGRLIVSLVIDLIGSASYLVPIVGEVADIGWAPLQVCLIMAMYDTTTPHLKYLSFAEEILPFTDFVPSATIGWAAQFGPQLLKSSSSSSTGVASTQLSIPNKGLKTH